jgi:hypothetical protein
MIKLNLPVFEFRIKDTGKRKSIFDEIRKKYVALTPEEWVRQNFVKYLIQHKNYPTGLISLEMAISINKNEKRCDIVVFEKTGKPMLLVECKSPNVEITQKSFDQAIVYNMRLNVKYLILTNGKKHFCWMINSIEKKLDFLDSIPEFEKA